MTVSPVEVARTLPAGARGAFRSLLVREATIVLPAVSVLALLVLVVTDGPTVVRLPLALACVAFATGVPIVGLLGLPRSPARTLLTVGCSLALSVVVAEALVLVGRLTPTRATLALLAGTTTFTAAQLLRRGSWEAPTRTPAALVRELRRAPRRPAVLTALAALAWVVAVVLVEPRDAGQLGLVSALPLVWWAGVALVTAGFVDHVRARRSKLNASLAALQVGVLVAFLYVVVTVAEPYSRIPTSYTHVGLVDYIVRDGRIETWFDGRYSWPGSLSLGAMLTQLAGADSSAALVRWAIPAFVALWAFAVYAVASAFSPRDAGGWVHPRRRPLPWIAVWVFVGLNWVGQDYWSSQALNFLLVLVVIAAVATWFPRRPRGRWTLRLLPDETAAAISSRQRLGLYVVLAAILLALATSHQLSPFLVTGALAVLWVVDRRDIRFLPVLAGLVTAVWLSWGAETYWVSHLSRLTENVGDVGSVITAGTAQRIGEGATGRRIVLLTRIVVSAAVWLGAGVCFVFLARRHARTSVTVAALVVAPIMAVGLQEYGGELLLRVFLFSLPFASILLAHAAHRGLRARWRVPWRAATVIAVIAAVGLGGFVVSRYGNEQFEQIYAEDVAVVREFYRVASPGDRMITSNTSNPFRMGPYDDYEFGSYSGLSKPEEIDLKAGLTLYGIPEGWFLITEAGIREAVVRHGARPGWERAFERELDGIGAQPVFREGRAALWRFSLEGVERKEHRPRRVQSLASREVRERLGYPAFAGAVSIVGLVGLLGAFHAAGRRPRLWADVVALAGAAGVLVLVLARFSALT